MEWNYGMGPNGTPNGGVKLVEPGFSLFATAATVARSHVDVLANLKKQILQNIYNIIVGHRYF